MELEYRGYEKNRGASATEFLKCAQLHIADLAQEKENNDHSLNILDIGCGSKAKFLRNILSNSNIEELCQESGKSLELYGISADRMPNISDINLYKRFLSSTQGLDFLPEQLKFDYILSSWCINYLTPKTFMRVVEDSLERLKPGGKIDLYPFQAVEYSCAFPRSIPSLGYYRDIASDLLNPVVRKREKLSDIKKKIFKLITLLDFEQILGKDFLQLQQSNDPRVIYDLFSKHFLSDNEILYEKELEVTLNYADRIFDRKYEYISKYLSNNPQYTHSIYQRDAFNTLTIVKEV